MNLGLHEKEMGPLDSDSVLQSDVMLDRVGLQDWICKEEDGIRTSIVSVSTIIWSNWMIHIAAYRARGKRSGRMDGAAIAPANIKVVKTAVVGMLVCVAVESTLGLCYPFPKPSDFSGRSPLEKILHRIGVTFRRCRAG